MLYYPATYQPLDIPEVAKWNLSSSHILASITHEHKELLLLTSQMLNTSQWHHLVTRSSGYTCRLYSTGSVMHTGCHTGCNPGGCHPDRDVMEEDWNSLHYGCSRILPSTLCKTVDCVLHQSLQSSTMDTMKLIYYYVLSCEIYSFNYIFD